MFSSVSGGYGGEASGNISSVGGGDWNIASGAYSTVSGGFGEEATDERDWLAGGQFAELQDEVSGQAAQLGALEAALGGEAAAREAGDISTLTGAYAYTDTQIEAALGGFDPDEVAGLSADVDALEAKLAPFSTAARPGGGYDVYLTEANLHIHNGLGATNGYPTDPLDTSPYSSLTNGLGNLIIGYNEAIGDRWDAVTGAFVPWEEADRAGSHNLVLGINNGYPWFGGLLAGMGNYIGGPYASVSGGSHNTASCNGASVTGGVYNRAIGDYASVSGGAGRSASGSYDWCAGGLFQDE
jgi:hypothetical protein